MIGPRNTSALFFIVLASVVAGLLFGSELVRWIMAAALIVVALPLYLLIGRSAVSNLIQSARKRLTTPTDRDLE